MHDLPASTHAARGYDLLLQHCTAVERLADARLPAFDRLEEALGGELARLLVMALAAHRNARAAA